MNPSKGWKREAPKTLSERREVETKCGKRAFLMPSKLKFPVMPKCHHNRCSCKPSCKALLAAYRRAAQYGHPTVKAKARRKAKSLKCSWVH